MCNYDAVVFPNKLSATRFDAAQFSLPPTGEPWHHPYRPCPEPLSGRLVVDPDITLPAQVLDLQINFFYTSDSNVDEEYGKNRRASVKGYALTTVTVGEA